MMRPIVPLLVVLLTVLASSSAALADCAEPTLQLEPRNGSDVPPDPHLWLFTMAWYGTDPVVRVEDDAGREVEHVLSAVHSDSPDIRAFRLELDHDDAARTLHVEVEVGDGRKAASWDYTIDPDWMAPSDAAVSIVSSTHEADGWMCSYTDVLRLKVDRESAAAYQVEYASTAEAWDAGARKRVILPGNMGRFFEPGTKQAREVSLELGHSNCIGHTIDWPGGAVLAGVIAHDPNGRETRLPEPTVLTCKSCK